MKIVILGAGYAGITAALRLARRGGSAFDISLVTESPCFTERIRLHEIAAGHSAKRHAIADLLGDARVTLNIGRVDDVRTLAWDRLVLALGSRVDDRVPGVREHTVLLDSAVVYTRGRVVVVGGGLTGIEVATELAETHRDLRVTLVSRGELGAGFSEAARSAFRDACDRLGVEVLTHASVRRVEAGRLVLDGGELSFDSCVWRPAFSRRRFRPASRCRRTRSDRSSSILCSGPSGTSMSSRSAILPPRARWAASAHVPPAPRWRDPANVHRRHRSWSLRGVDQGARLPLHAAGAAPRAARAHELFGIRGAGGGVSSERKHLFDIAYRMLGSAADAEEMVQEALLRFHSLGSAETAAIQTPAAYLSTIVTRLYGGLARLRSRQAHARCGARLTVGHLRERLSWRPRVIEKILESARREPR